MTSCFGVSTVVRAPDVHCSCLLLAASEELREVTYGEIATANSIESIDKGLDAVSDVANRVSRYRY